MPINEIVSTNTYTVLPGDPISKVIGSMKETTQKNAFVVDEKMQPVGIVDRKDLLRTKINVAEEKVSSVMENSISVSDEDDLRTVISHIIERDLWQIPYLKNGKVAGQISVLDCLNALVEDREITTTSVREVMTRELVTLKMDDPLSKAFNKLKDRERIPVIGDDGKIAGILSIWDYIEWMLKPLTKSQHGERSGERDSMLSIETKSLMSDKIETCTPEDKLSDIIPVFSSLGIGCIIVMDAGSEVKGIITAKDILRFYLKEQYTETFDFNIQYSGLDNFEYGEVRKAKRLLMTFARKTSYVPKIDTLKVQFKKYSKSRKENMYSIHVELFLPGKVLAAKGSEWQMELAINTAFNALRRQAKKYLKK